MKKILVVAVHPDDETLGCGGTLLKHKSKGDQIFWLILTKANQNSTSIPNIIEKQADYIRKVARNYDFDGWNQLTFLTTELDRYPLKNLIDKISEYFNRIKPNIIYYHHHADIHSDHKIAFNAVCSCTKNFRYPFFDRILLFETLSETEFAPAIMHNAFTPNSFIDITEFLEKKLEIIKLFTTEQMEEPNPRAESSIRALARYRGSRIGVEYAEAFELIFEKE